VKVYCHANLVYQPHSSAALMIFHHFMPIMFERKRKSVSGHGADGKVSTKLAPKAMIVILISFFAESRRLVSDLNGFQA
jgi:hypothetical protein